MSHLSLCGDGETLDDAGKVIHTGLSGHDVLRHGKELDVHKKESTEYTRAIRKTGCSIS